MWLYATARRVIANQRRSRRRRDALHERLVLEATFIPQDPTSEQALVHEALRRLGPADREVLLLAEWEGLSPAQIASVLGVSPGDRTWASPPRAAPLQDGLRKSVGG